MGLSSEQLEELVTELVLGDPDVVVMGDGSGSTAELPCGWFYTLFDRRSRWLTEEWGGVSGGTNNYAELSPYLHAMWVYHTRTFGNGELRLKPNVSVAIVSDSEITVRCGNRQYERRANAGLWAQIEWYEAHGYRMYWHHVTRNSTPFHVKADRLANVARRKLTEMIAT